MAAEKNASARGYAIRTLVVDGIEIRTNLTEADLKDGRLWGMRTPSAWAAAIRSGSNGPAAGRRANP